MSKKVPFYDYKKIESAFFDDNIRNKESLFSRPEFEQISEVVKQREEQLTKKLDTTSYGKCNNCGSLDNSLIPKQSRSADEPITFFIKCNKCGAQWIQ